MTLTPDTRIFVTGHRGLVGSAPRKLLDVRRLHGLGWRHRMALGEGLAVTYQWFEQHLATARLGSHHTP
jgi:hypothetical protein